QNKRIGHMKSSKSGDLLALIKSKKAIIFTFVMSYGYISYVLTILYGKRPYMWDVCGRKT
ncbi:MAG: hypothetical protein WB501_04690, partial [Nitrososphaeraceae archaeon]